MGELTKKQLLLQEAALLEKKKSLKVGLPHLYGWKHYTWSRKFYESTNRENFLVAANQVGKSSVNIRKCIYWATSPHLWPKLWNTQFGQPNLFWYFYPTRDIATAEFHTKWSQFMPANEYKNHPQYGWRVEMERKQLMAIHFNTGVSVYFKTYSQSAQDLQTGTVFALFLDEELPIELLPELQARLNASDGYFHLVFTATIGQDHWRKCMEEQGRRLETHKGALKLNASLFECQKFEDGSPSHWTSEKIQRAIAKCPNKAEVQRRVYGRFVVSDGLKYAAFDHDRNSVDSRKIPAGWHIYSGVDVGSGGQSGHPAGIVFVAVSPDYKQGEVFLAWRGDGVDTTPTDILIKYRTMREELTPIEQVYDWASKDFFNVASRMGEAFVKAEKNHEIGEGILNTLFRHSMLRVHRGDEELEKLVSEISGLLSTTPKTKAKDDLVDALRYVCAAIPWDYAAVDENIDLEMRFQKAAHPHKPKTLTHTEQVNQDREEMRRDWLKNGDSNPQVDELTEWQDLYGT